MSPTSTEAISTTLGSGTAERAAAAAGRFAERAARDGLGASPESFPLAIDEAPVDTLINSLSAGCPFTNPEKQALLEARTLEDRCAALISLLQMERPGQGGGYVQ